KILQDADRLDALGAIGIARVFATGGSLKRPFYNTDDPFCKTRKPDDKIWTVDHFYQKLLKLESTMNTKSGKIEATKRTRVLRGFLKQLKQEL
ncbi:MAG: phosphohydrolase, partial [Nitrosopumilus sp.]|nr:phosphohydrolase [Nitrosopumilus sp.]NNL36831.1 phosphohydrolase [Nitrosopumilus sp.]